MSTTSHHRRAYTVSALLLAASASLASSHREAPFITEMPKVDGTDFYMFRSTEPGRENFITIVACYVPLQDPYGGPNYFLLDPTALYQIHIDNNADAREDLTFSFRFRNESRNISLSIGGESVAIPLVNVGPVTNAGDPNLNVVESYTVDLITGDRDTGARTPVRNAMTKSATFLKPVDNIGNKSIPNYDAYASQHMYEIALPGGQTGRMFVGQRKDPFVVNLGEAFDLVNTNPLGAEDGEQDDLFDKNVTSFIIELPISYVLGSGTDPVFGAWTTSSVPTVRTLNSNPGMQVPELYTKGGFTQVSRLSHPLVNELVIGLKDKNKFNNSEPVNDGQFLTYVTNPTLPALLNVLFGVTAPCLPRNDLVAIFLTGVPGLTQPQSGTPSEMLRLNTSVPITPQGLQNRLGVIGGDLAGYPNGRRLGDDVVDISLRAVMGVLLDSTCSPQGQLPYTDGAIVNDSFFDASFPYVRSPIPGSPN